MAGRTGPLVAEVLGSAPPAWLTDAEVSVPCGRAGTPALSLFFERDAEFDAFTGAVPQGALLREHERLARDRFDLVPRRWIKVGDRFSQYFQVHPAIRYPLTTLRVFLRQYGVGDVRPVASLLAPALAEAGAIWWLVLKHDVDGGIVPRLACRLSRPAALEQLQRLSDASHLDHGTSSAYADMVRAIPGAEVAILSVEPGLPGSCAVDFEDVPAASVPGAAATLPGVEQLSYAKVRVLPGGGREWTAYVPLDAWRRVAGLAGPASLPTPDG